MIESHSPNETPATNAPLKPNGAFSAPSSSNYQTSPIGSKNKVKNRVLFIALVIFFIAAAVGGIFAYQALNKGKDVNITQAPPSFAWKPTVTGNCAGGKVVGNAESVPYGINLDLTLNGAEKQRKTFASKPPNNTISEEFAWPFTAAVKNGDKISWTAKVFWEGNDETYQGTITISDCAASSATPTASASATPRVSATPTSTPRVTATPRPSSTATPVVTASPSASPTQPPVGGPSNTPTPTPTPSATATSAPTSTPTSTPNSTQTTSNTPTPENKAVANASDLPKAGISASSVALLILGTVSLILSALLASRKKKYW